MKNNRSQMAASLAAIFILFGTATVVMGQEGASTLADTCDTISLARPGRGVIYTGLVRNSDYHFSSTIPAGLTGWGAGPGAPFHGFVIYLTNKSSEASCINFEVGLHVDLPEDHASSPATPKRAVRVRVGNRVGTQTSIRGSNQGTNFENVMIALALSRSSDRIDYSITFITPTKDVNETQPIFERFLSQLHFEWP